MAVYTEVADEALVAFLADYDLGELVSYRGIAEGVENSNYTLRTSAGDFILTLYEKRVDPADLPWFLGLIEHLARHGIPCPRPVPGRDGAALRWLAGRRAAITTFLPGVWPRRVTRFHCAELGEALGRLHLAGLGYAPERANALGPACWPALVAANAARAEEVAPALGPETEAAAEDLVRRWPLGLPRGHIHADLFPDNVFFLSGRISGLIDFYFAATDFLAYDIAVCLNAWCFEADGTFNVTKGRALLGRYQAVRMIEAAEWAALPILCRGAALRFLLTRLHDWLNTPPGALVVRKDPIEYLHRMRFHAGVKDGREYGS